MSTALPQDLAAFARVTDPVARAQIEEKLRRYIARGLWAQEALVRLQSGRQTVHASQSDAEAAHDTK